MSSSDFFIDAMTGFSQNGLWPAVQSFVIFLVTNIFAHAASISQSAQMLERSLSVLCGVIAPISLRRTPSESCVVGDVGCHFA
jgi:hypothetical protein